MLINVKTNAKFRLNLENSRTFEGFNLMRIRSLIDFTRSVRTGIELLFLILMTIIQSACGGGAAAISGAGQAVIFIDSVADTISAADKFALDRKHEKSQ